MAVDGRVRLGLALLQIASLAQVLRASGDSRETRCSGIDIRNNPRYGFNRIKKHDLECTIVEGDFIVSMITMDSVTDDDFPVFKNLREITGSIIVFHVRALTSIGKMLPNLRVIGGDNLIMNYALVIYQNRDLKTVGLSKLKLIKNGGVRIVDNARLCYTRYINWNSFLYSNIRDVIVDPDDAQCQEQCIVTEPDDCETSEGHLSCWSANTCQRKFCEHHRYPNGTFGPGCTEAGNVCHPLCLGGCFKPNDPSRCFTCRFVEINGVCVEKCPDNLFEMNGRRCVSEKHCHSLIGPMDAITQKSIGEYKAFKGRCDYHCREGYQEDPNNNRSCVKCMGDCPKVCRVNGQIDSTGAALRYKSCNIIQGSLEIEVRIGNEANIEKFTEAFGEVTEITGFLMIRFSSMFVSLNMFKNLRVIKGEELWRGAYALVVLDNANLRELFPMKSIDIRAGKVQFQNNRMLCYKKIDDFLSRIGMKGKLTEVDVSEHSNGDKAVCEEMALEVEVTGVEPYGFIIRWNALNTTDMDYRKFIGYQIFYKKVDHIDPDISIDDDRSACSDSWRMQFTEAGVDPDDINALSAKHTSGELVTTGVEANSLYAFYVQTRIVKHPGARNAISKVHFVRTHFGNPDPPRIRDSEALGPDSVEVSFDPPGNPRGTITHYTIEWERQDDTEMLAHVDACKDNWSKRPRVQQTVPVPKKAADTCSKQTGCCDCSEVQRLKSYLGHTEDDDQGLHVMGDAPEKKVAEQNAFENAIQNHVFIQRCAVHYDPRYCGPRPPPIKDPPLSSIQGLVPEWKALFRHSSESGKSSQHQKRRRHAPRFNGQFNPVFMYENSSSAKVKRDVLRSAPSSKVSAKDILSRNHFAFNISRLNLDDPGFPESFKQSGRLNITGTQFVLAGLPHFTEYMISLYACQDVDAPDNSCSQKPVWVNVRTSMISGNDIVNETTVRLGNGTHDDVKSRDIYWEPPENPNGPILAYKVTLMTGKDSTPMTKCLNVTNYGSINGTVFKDLSDGTYDLYISTVTLAGTSEPLVIEAAFQLRNDFLSQPRNIVMIVLGILLTLAVLLLVFYLIFQNTINERMKDLDMRNMVMNPEYLSQMALYKKDEWELERDCVELFEELGKGQFGKVFHAIGKSIKSQCGVVFGDCAVKQLSSEEANKHRMYFLLEANVMKQFKTSFIVKLYGVVSDHPVFVVMEYMEYGSLKDYMCRFNPHDEAYCGEVIDTKVYFQWAAQIADGMAYLEAAKFVHRDLAARNCLVNKNLTVKIGDFGFARDVYYKDYYRPQGNHMMPVRWMSPEALRDGKYTSKSDVWSYGVVIYEIVTLGAQPYAGLSNDLVFEYVVNERLCMAAPKDCPDIWYGLMRVCWRYDPKERPNFWEIVHYMADFLKSDDPFVVDSFVLNSDSNNRSLIVNFEEAVGIEDYNAPNNGFTFYCSNEKFQKNSTRLEDPEAADDVPLLARGRQVKRADSELSSHRRPGTGDHEDNGTIIEEESGDEFDEYYSESRSSSENTDATSSATDATDYGISEIRRPMVRDGHRYLANILGTISKQNMSRDSSANALDEQLLLNADGKKGRHEENYYVPDSDKPIMDYVTETPSRNNSVSSKPSAASESPQKKSKLSTKQSIPMANAMGENELDELRKQYHINAVLKSGGPQENYVTGATSSPPQPPANPNCVPPNPHSQQSRRNRKWFK